jgi:16S rRNA (cytidine1402-2'-O)-methyltransferase
VATPIGNLGDFSHRAVAVLQRVDFIACEDTRHSRALLAHYGINKPLIALHEHNEAAASVRLVQRLEQGESMALISDAGTPLINDPGFPLVRLALERGLQVMPIPGACALIAALSVSGLATDRFAFEGFPPRTASARRSYLEGLREDTRTLIFYESSHRIREFVEDIAKIFPADRWLVVARELTKLHETILRCSVADASTRIQNDPYMEKGEFVVLLQGAPPKSQGSEELTAEQERVLKLLLEECSVKSAVALTVKIAGARKELAYQAALRLTAQHS